MMIPLLDLRAAHQELADDIDLAIKQVIETSSFILGDQVRLFEKEFAALKLSTVLQSAPVWMPSSLFYERITLGLETR